MVLLSPKILKHINILGNAINFTDEDGDCQRLNDLAQSIYTRLKLKQVGGA